MRILHLRASNFYGGPERQLHLHGRELKGSEYGLTIGSFSEQRGTPEFLEVIASDGIDTSTFQVTGAYDPAAVRKLREYLAAEQVELLCTHDYRSHVIGWRAARQTSARWVAFSRGWTSESPKVKLYHLLDKAIVRFAAHIVAVSQAQKDKLVRLKIRPDKVTVVHNAVDIATICSAPPVDLKQRFGFPGDAVIFVAGGRFSSEKGQKYLVQAALAAIKADSRLRFVLFGDGPDLESIRRLISSSGESQTIICPGFERNMLGCLRGADGLINPSLSEGLPNIVLEAMAAGTPVIATAVGGVPELITDGHGGWLVPSCNASEIVAKIMSVATDTDRVRKITEAARNTVERDFTFGSQAKKLTQVYRETLARSPIRN